MAKIGLVFPGQGSQNVGMGKKLYEKYAVAKETYEAANDILGFNLKQLCFEGDMDELTKTDNAQPALLTASVAAFRVYMQEFGMEPAFLAGHSLGEISALTCAGGIEFSDALKIVRKRGKFMQDAVPLGVGAMMAISGVSRELIEKTCKKHTTKDQIVVISNYNSPDQIVISGHKNAVTAAADKLKEQKAVAIPLKVSAPFHSPLMKPAADQLNEELRKYTYHDLKWPVMSNVYALPYPGKDKIIEYLTAQIVESVRWTDSVEYLESQGVEYIIELGPKKVLKDLVKKITPKITGYSFDLDDDIAAIKKLAPAAPATPAAAAVPSVPATPAAPVQAKAVNADMAKAVTRCLAIAVCTRNTNWDNDEYQKGVVEPYQRIQKLQLELEKEGKQPTVAQVKEALEMLRSVFKTKRTPVQEQIERFNQVFNETGIRDVIGDFEMPA